MVYIPDILDSIWVNSLTLQSEQRWLSKVNSCWPDDYTGETKRWSAHNFSFGKVWMREYNSIATYLHLWTRLITTIRLRLSWLDSVMVLMAAGTLSALSQWSLPSTGVWSADLSSGEHFSPRGWHRYACQGLTLKGHLQRRCVWRYRLFSTLTDVSLCRNDSAFLQRERPWRNTSQRTPVRACMYLCLGGVGSDGWGIYCIHKWLSEFPMFSSVVKVVHSSRPAALPTSSSPSCKHGCHKESSVWSTEGLWRRF